MARTCSVALPPVQRSAGTASSLHWVLSVSTGCANLVSPIVFTASKELVALSIRNGLAKSSGQIYDLDRSICLDDSG